jgi:hypothetical protein
MHRRQGHAKTASHKVVKSRVVRGARSFQYGVEGNSLFCYLHVRCTRLACQPGILPFPD